MPRLLTTGSLEGVLGAASLFLAPTASLQYIVCITVIPTYLVMEAIAMADAMAILVVIPMAVPGAVSKAVAIGQEFSILILRTTAASTAAGNIGNQKLFENF